MKLGDEVKDGRPAARWRGFNLTEMLNRDWNPDAAGLPWAHGSMARFLV